MPKRIQVGALTDNEHRAIENAAKAAHMPMTVYCRKVLLDTAADAGFNPAPDIPAEQQAMEVDNAG